MELAQCRNRTHNFHTTRRYLNAHVQLMKCITTRMKPNFYLYMGAKTDIFKFATKMEFYFKHFAIYKKYNIDTVVDTVYVALTVCKNKCALIHVY